MWFIFGVQHEDLHDEETTPLARVDESFTNIMGSNKRGNNEDNDGGAPKPIGGRCK